MKTLINAGKPVLHFALEIFVTPFEPPWDDRDRGIKQRAVRLPHLDVANLIGRDGKPGSLRGSRDPLPAIS